MSEIKLVKKMCEILNTDIDHLIPSIEKMIREVENQEKEIKKLKERLG